MKKKIPPVALIAGLGVLGFVAYEFWWKPKALADEAARDPRQLQAAQALLEQAQLVQSQNPGMSLRDAFDKMGTTVCQGIGAYYGVPPQASGGVCALAVKLGNDIAIKTTKLGYEYTRKGVEVAAKGVAQGAKLALWTAPKIGTEKTLQVLKYGGYTAPLAVTRYTGRALSSGARSVGSGISTGARAVANAGETVLSKLNPTNWF